MRIDLVNREGISTFMNMEDYQYKKLSDSVKHYSVRQHLIDIAKSDKYSDLEYWTGRLLGDKISRIFRTSKEKYWSRGLNYSIVDVGANYGIFSMFLAKYIKTSRQFVLIRC